MPLFLFEFLINLTVFLFGACVGSFLNVVIYRLPNNLGVNNPKRSFCPRCKTPIPVYRNIPLFTWLWQRGRAACCGERIPARYFIVELATALLFVAVWQTQLSILAPIYFFMLALLIAGTFIDIDHYIIPDEITYGLTFAGLLGSFAFPQLMGVGLPDDHPFFISFDLRIEALGHSAFGALTGFILLYAIVELGKLLFGRKRVQLDKAEEFSWIRSGDDATLTMGQDDPEKWSEIFFRKSDRLILSVEELFVDGEKIDEPEAVFTWEKLRLKDRELQLDHIDKITGRITAVTIPREAMGFGDVKLMTGLGAFLGWGSVPFALGAGSIIGLSFTLGAVIARRREFSQQIPFGPYLAAGALVWLFAGEEIMVLYQEFFLPKDTFFY